MQSPRECRYPMAFATAQGHKPGECRRGKPEPYVATAFKCRPLREARNRSRSCRRHDWEKQHRPTTSRALVGGAARLPRRRGSTFETQLRPTAASAAWRRVNNIGAHRRDGHGLGLSIVQPIGTTHHATITAHP
jgi:hypothetical protein